MIFPPLTIIHDFLKLPYAISEALGCVAAVDDGKTVDMVIPTQNLDVIVLGGGDEGSDLRDTYLG